MNDVVHVTAPILRAPGTPMRLEPMAVMPPEPGEVLVRLVASGVCHTCLHTIDGSIAGIPMPIVLGDEGAGVVEEIGSGVTGLKRGDHVVLSWAPSCGACRQCLKGRPALCTNKLPFGLLRDGATAFRCGDEVVYHFGPSTFSPYVVVPSSAAVKVSDELPLERAVLVGCAVTTGAGAVLRTAGVRFGESVVVIGCGGIGLNAIQAAALAGGQPIVGVDPVELKLEAARRFGATETIRYRGSSIAGEVRAITRGGADVAVVAVGSTEMVQQAVDALAPGGRCVIVGVPPSGDLIQLDPNVLRAEEKIVMGSSY
jgi:S-(hydroxymethyl)glutathione dehydrogenase/alcohol dehydrogenase